MSALRAIDGLRARLDDGSAVRAAVVGGGVSGRAAARLLCSRGAAVRVLDGRPETVEGLPDGVELERLTAAALAEAELVILSPGVPRALPELAGALAEGRLVGEAELASWWIDVPLIGITGTNGKSTTTALVGHVLGVAGRSAFVGGNLGAPLCEAVLGESRAEVCVAELSSYQLESVERARFAVGVWLNLAPDHLDRYPDLAAYAAAKARLLERVEVGGVQVVNADDDVVRRAARSVERPRRWFSRQAELPAEEGGTFVDGLTAARGDERYTIDGPGLLGAHNRDNAAAAIEVARALGVSPQIGRAHV